MGKQRILIKFDYDQSWIGGTYYLLNLIKALKSLEDNRPEITILTKSDADFQKVKQETEYPDLKKHQYREHLSRWQRVANKLGRIIGLRPFFDVKIKAQDHDAFYPARGIKIFEHIPRPIYWIPDFQERTYPEFFTEEQLTFRKKAAMKISEREDLLVLSSESAKEDYEALYPEHRSKVFVVPFAVIHHQIAAEPELTHLNLPGEYFICSNQFWKHKNHLTLLKAIAHLGENAPMVIFTGNPTNSDGNEHYASLLSYVEENDIQEKVRFLGFVDRSVQLALIEKSKAIVQPSSFEGWSTIVEDAKALGKTVIASDLSVHKEQLERNGIFFSTFDHEELANCLIGDIDKIEPLDYQENIVKFASKFMEAVSFCRNKYRNFH